MPSNKPVWKDYQFTYTNKDDGVHIEHIACGKDIGSPEFWLKASTAKCLIEKHAVLCGRDEEGKNT